MMLDKAAYNSGCPDFGAVKVQGDVISTLGLIAETGLSMFAKMLSALVLLLKLENDTSMESILVGELCKRGNLCQ